MGRKSLTLIELIVVMVLMGVIILGISASSMFFINQAAVNIERHRIYSQINYAFEDMKLRCVSASDISTLIAPGGNSQSLTFFGEEDIYRITPNNLTDNVMYQYVKEGDYLVLKTGSPGNQSIEVLVDRGESINVTFEHQPLTEPNLLRVIIRSEIPKKRGLFFKGMSTVIFKTDVIKFWFIDAVT